MENCGTHAPSTRSRASAGVRSAVSVIATRPPIQTEPATRWIQSSEQREPGRRGLPGVAGEPGNHQQRAGGKERAGQRQELGHRALLALRLVEPDRDQRRQAEQAEHQLEILQRPSQSRIADERDGV